MKKLFLVRHGETEWSLSKRHTGSTDLPLTENGKKEALALKPILEKRSFEKVFVSPLKRARETCALMNPSAPVEFDEDLREWDYGDYEGLTSEQIHKIDPSWSIFSKGAPRGESLEQIQARAERFLHKIDRYQGDVLLISSGHILRALAAVRLGLPPSFGSFLVLSTASLSILGREHEKPAILLWNETFF